MKYTAMRELGTRNSIQDLGGKGSHLIFSWKDGIGWETRIRILPSPGNPSFRRQVYHPEPRTLPLRPLSFKTLTANKDSLSQAQATSKGSI